MTDTNTDDSISNAPKFHKDRSSYGDSLRGWFEKTAGWSEVRITDLQIPIATGFSNETVVFSAEWREGGEHHAERLVARIEPPDGGLFPVQTPEVAVSVGLQYRIMDAVGRLGAAPVPPLVGFEADPGVLGQPFFVMRFATPSRAFWSMRRHLPNDGGWFRTGWRRWPASTASTGGLPSLAGSTPAAPVIPPMSISWRCTGAT
jgi:hypothetical protein